jgi:hypothetical protein
MDLLVIGAIALAGYGLSSGRRRDAFDDMTAESSIRAAPLSPAAEFPGDEENDTDTRKFDREYRRLAEQRWQAARDPAATGVVDPAVVRMQASLQPFFKSAKAQHTSDAFKQTRLETFTGANDLATSKTGTYRNKREVEAMFSPSYTAAAVTSSGSAGNAATGRELGRYEAGTVHNNVRPAEQLTVGRGMGVGPDVMAAEGFHPTYRVMMGNINEHRVNQLPARIIPGAHPTSGKAADAPTQTVNDAKTGSLVYDDVRRPAMPVQASVKAHRVYPVEPNGTMLTAPRPEVRDWVGIATMQGPHAPAPAQARARYDVGDNPDRNKALPGMHGAAARVGIGAFTSSSFDMPTQARETEGRAGHVAGTTARMAPSAKVLPPTQRGLAPVAAPMGGVGVIRSGGRPRGMDAPKPTHRQGVSEREAPLMGTRAAVLAGSLDNAWRYRRLSRATARATQLRAHTPGMARVNVVVPAAAGSYAASRSALSVPEVPKQATVNNPSYYEHVGASTGTRNKLPTHNARATELGIAMTQLEGNPYAQQSFWNV